jgi:hypothetical protein
MSESNPLPIDKPRYSVGVAANGRTQLVINTEYGTTVITMDADGVEQMIRLLEATL